MDTSTNHWIELIRAGEVSDHLLYSIYHGVKDPIVQEYIAERKPRVAWKIDQWEAALVAAIEERGKDHPVVFKVSKSRYIAKQTLGTGGIWAQSKSPDGGRVGFNIQFKRGRTIYSSCLSEVYWLPWRMAYQVYVDKGPGDGSMDLVLEAFKWLSAQTGDLLVQDLGGRYFS